MKNIGTGIILVYDDVVKEGNTKDMYCINCGAEIKDNLKFCTNCGEPIQKQDGAPQTVNEEPPVQVQSVVAKEEPPVQAQPEMVKEQIPPAAPIYTEPSSTVIPGYGPKANSLKEYVTMYGDEKTKKSLRNISIWMYVLAGFNLVAGFVLSYSVLDAILIAALGFWYQKTYSFVAIVGFLAYTILSMVISFVQTGGIYGWMSVIIAVGAFYVHRRVQKSYEQYLKNYNA